jgi:hypothetical protein
VTTSVIETPKEPEKENNGSGKKIFLLVFILFIVLGVIVGGIFVYKKSMPGSGPTTVSPTPTLSQEPTPTLEPVSKDTLKIDLLNGGGVVGAGGKAKTYLESLGYKNIETGNADNYKYVQTEISIKDSKKSVLDQLITDLSKKYKVASETGILQESNQFDIKIILGK